jgi:hypothetical protein
MLHNKKRKKAERQARNISAAQKSFASFSTALTTRLNENFMAGLKRRRNFLMRFQSDYDDAQSEIRTSGSSAGMEKAKAEEKLTASRNPRTRRKLPMSVRIKGGY